MIYNTLPANDGGFSVLNSKFLANFWVGTRENEGTERDIQGVGWDMSPHFLLVGTKPGVGHGLGHGVGHGLGHGVGHGVGHGLPVVNKVKKNNKKNFGVLKKFRDILHV